MKGWIQAITQGRALKLYSAQAEPGSEIDKQVFEIVGLIIPLAACYHSAVSRLIYQDPSANLFIASSTT